MRLVRVEDRRVRGDLPHGRVAPVRGLRRGRRPAVAVRQVVALGRLQVAARVGLVARVEVRVDEAGACGE